MIYDRPFDPNKPLNRQDASAAAIAARRSTTTSRAARCSASRS